jgi:hypothetical protein
LSKNSIKEGYKVLLLNAPSDYQARLDKLSAKVIICTDSSGKPFDLIQVFVSTKKQLEEQLPKTKELLREKGLLWVTYQKGKAEVNKDTIREFASTLGLQGVSLVAVDETWSALRLKIV